MKNNFPQNVHFVGIGGIGMSGLAKHLLKLGCTVCGSDRQENIQTEKLRALGAQICVPHCAKNVQNAQLLVRTSAVPTSNEEVQFALAHNIPVVLREQFLGQIFDSFPVRIAVCGTHGKTTVTAMVHHVLERCGISHAAFIGGEYDGENYFFGTNAVVAEACEYNRSFLNLHPTICLCLNCEFDHPDCYKNQAEVEQAFRTLFEQSQTVVLPSNQKYLWQNACLFGEEGVSARDIAVDECGRPHFSVWNNGEFFGKCKLKVCGKHNVQNALAALSVAKLLNLPLLQALQALETFRGVDRRWTEQPCQMHVVCDYAHHPTEIAAAVKTAKDVCKGKLFCVFQPHTYSRTKAFLPQFVSCFDGAETLVLLPVYPAREKPFEGATSFQLYRLAKEKGKNAKYFATFQRAADFLRRNVKENDLVLLVGAGDVNELAQLLT